MTNTFSCRSLFLSLLSVLVFYVGFGHAQKKQGISIVDRSRPIAAAAEQLSMDNDWLVSYEDPQYLYSGDLEDVTNDVARAKGFSVGPRSKRFIVPRKGSVTLDYRRGDNPTTVAQRLAARSSELGTEFQVQTMGSRIVFMPARVRDKSGQLGPQTPYLSRHISISEMDRDGNELLSAICMELSETTGVRVVIGTGPNFGRIRTSISAIDEPARDVLIRFLDSVDPTQRIVWYLNYDPGDAKFFLNFGYVVPKRRQ